MARSHRLVGVGVLAVLAVAPGCSGGELNDVEGSGTTWTEPSEDPTQPRYPCPGHVGDDAGQERWCNAPLVSITSSSSSELCVAGQGSIEPSCWQYDAVASGPPPAIGTCAFVGFSTPKAFVYVV